MNIRKLQRLVEGFRASLVEQGGPDMPWYLDATFNTDSINPADLGLPDIGSWEFVSPADEGSGQGSWVYTDILGYQWDVQTIHFGNPPMQGFLPIDPVPITPILILDSPKIYEFVVLPRHIGRLRGSVRAYALTTFDFLLVQASY